MTINPYGRSDEFNRLQTQLGGLFLKHEDHFCALLEQMLANPEQSLRSIHIINLLSFEVRSKLLSRLSISAKDNYKRYIQAPNYQEPKDHDIVHFGKELLKALCDKNNSILQNPFYPKIIALISSMGEENTFSAFCEIRIELVPRFSLYLNETLLKDFSSRLHLNNKALHSKILQAFKRPIKDNNSADDDRDIFRFLSIKSKAQFFASHAQSWNIKEDPIETVFNLPEDLAREILNSLDHRELYALASKIDDSNQCYLWKMLEHKKPYVMNEKHNGSELQTRKMLDSAKCKIKSYLFIWHTKGVLQDLKGDHKQCLS